MSYNQLTLVERYQIEAYLAVGFSKKSIAERLNRDATTIRRELKRNTDIDGGYCALSAQEKADKRALNAAHKRISESCWHRVESLLRERLSPEQISHWLLKNEQRSVSVEWIYQYIRTDKDQGGDLFTYLRCQKKKKKRYGSTDKRGQIKNRISIDERPKVVELRQRVGDWELDTVIGSQGGRVLVTAVERKTRLSCIVLAENKTAEAVTEALLIKLEPIKDEVKTLTYDNGKEFSLHENISEKLDAKGYFAHPYHSWERGLNENTNGLIRQYLPKKMCFNQLTDDDIQAIEDQLNHRPRKCLNYQTPNQVFWNIDPPYALAS